MPNTLTASPAVPVFWAKHRHAGSTSLPSAPADYAYGKAGSPPKIPADATLDFEVELLSWKSTKDITDDGGVSKAILEEGKDWKKPGALDEVLGR